MSQFSKALREFVASKADFSIIYSTLASSNSSGGNTSTQQAAFVTPHTQRVCVLDSSFNPPHLGHSALVEELLRSNYDHIPNENKSLLLLLSVKNADKETDHLSLEVFEQRLDMIHLMANDLSKRFPINISIGLTNHAKFVDKSLSIISYIEEKFPDIVTPDFKLTFLIGFDTLVRILDPKYYLPDKFSQSLENFMKKTDLFCLTRHDAVKSLTQQEGYVKEISSGKHEDIPSHWSNNIFMLPSLNEEIANLSSSSIRKEILSQGHGDLKWRAHVIPEVAKYIDEHDIYLSTTS